MSTTQPPEGRDADLARAILTEAIEASGFDLDTLTGPSRLAVVVRWRHRAMYAIRASTALSYPNIGWIFGGRDHSSVQVAVEKVGRDDLESRRARTLATAGETRAFHEDQSTGSDR